MTELAEQLQIPYRTLQNYFSLTSDMPLWVYIAICRAARIDPTYPINGSFKLNHHALQQALIDTLGNLIPGAEADKGELRLVRNDGQEFSGADVRRFAATLAVLIQGRYDLVLERELSNPPQSD